MNEPARRRATSRTTWPFPSTWLGSSSTASCTPIRDRRPATCVPIPPWNIHSVARSTAVSAAPSAGGSPDEPELHSSGDILVPDIAGWRRQRMPALPETDRFDLAPDGACAARSPSTARLDRILKMSLYTREGVPQLWLVDPDVRTQKI